MLDQHAVPTRDEVDGWISSGRAAGYRRIRSSALFPAAAEVVIASGFAAVDSLALLRADLADLADPTDPADGADLADPRLSIRAMRGWHHADAARIDQDAFGVEWGNNSSSLRSIRHATPNHRACRAVVDGELAGFAISGAGGRTGYLQRLAIAPPHRRAGAATALVADGLAWMRRRGLSSALVNTGITNEPALGLYARFGFRRLADQLTIAEYVLDPGPS